MATLLFDEDFDERAQFEAHSKGYLSHVRVRIADGKVYSVIFYDPVRLGQDLEVRVSMGKVFLADPGMIVLSEVTLANMQVAVDRLESGKFFEALVSVAGA